MQNFFSTWAVAVTVAILFSAVVNALLPDTSIKKYVSVVLGIVVTLIMLSPLFTLFNGTNFRDEIDQTLKSINDTSNYEYDGATYKDYIFEVYMDGE